MNIPLVVYLTYGSTANFRFLGPIAKIYISKEREGYGVRSGARILEIDQVIGGERSERDTLRSVQLRIADILYIYMVRAKFVLITRKEGGA